MSTPLVCKKKETRIEIGRPLKCQNVLPTLACLPHASADVFSRSIPCVISAVHTTDRKNEILKKLVCAG